MLAEAKAQAVMCSANTGPGRSAGLAGLCCWKEVVGRFAD
jgi:hypothetical protein